MTARRTRKLSVGIALLASGAIAVLAACAGMGGEAAAPDTAMTASGPVTAVERAAMKSYFAIPYAAPPTGDLRWRAPQPAASWTSRSPNAKSAASCLQTGDSPFRVNGDSEDCLYLDVHAPTGSGPFPVMVWIHGGAFNTGAASVYADPTPLVSKGVIVVAIDYRLGAMGFLGHPALRDADGSVGNYGIMDQQAALGWVQANIAQFGGDTKNVTIFGESAGGFSVMTHLASPLSAGLFSKAIIQSGAYGVSSQLTQAELEKKSTAIAEKVILTASNLPGCSVDAITAACLRGLSDALVRNQLATAFAVNINNPVPSVDGKVLPATIKDTFAAGRNNKVPVINGSNQDEFALFFAMNELASRTKANPPNLDPTDKRYLMKAAAYPMTVNALAAGGGLGVSGSQLSSTDYPLASYGTDTDLQASLAATALATDATFSCNGLQRLVPHQGAGFAHVDVPVPRPDRDPDHRHHRRQVPTQPQSGRGARCRTPLRLQHARPEKCGAHRSAEERCRNTGSTSRAPEIPTEMASGNGVISRPAQFRSSTWRPAGASRSCLHGSSPLSTNATASGRG